MSITTLTINTIDYISYASQQEADDFLAVDPTRGAAWAALDDTTKQSHLVAATRRIDLFEFSGEKTGGESQLNAWSRTGATCNGDPVTVTDDVPIGIENATILIAGTIAITPAVANQGSSGTNIKRVRAGTAEVEFFQPQDGVPIEDETAYSLLACFLANASTGAGFGLAAGVSSESEFCDEDEPGLNEGFA